MLPQQFGPGWQLAPSASFNPQPQPPQPGPPGPARPWITVYQPTNSGGRWIARADLRMGRELIELQASASDSLVQSGQGIYDQAASWLGDRVSYRAEPSRPLRGLSRRSASFGQDYSALGASRISAVARRPLTLTQPAGVSLAAPGYTAPDLMRIPTGVFANLPVIANLIAQSDAVPIDSDVIEATEKVKRAHEGDQQSIGEIAIIQEHASKGQPEAIDALETIGLADDAVCRPEQIDMPRLCCGVGRGDRAAKKLLAALHAAAPPCVTRLEWCLEDYTQRGEAALMTDVACALTEQIEGRLSIPWSCREACDRGERLPESVGPAAFSKPRRIRPSYHKPMLEALQTMLAAPYYPAGIPLAAGVMRG